MQLLPLYCFLIIFVGPFLFSCMLMTFCSAVFGFLFISCIKSYRFLVCSYHVLHIYQARFIAAYPSCWLLKFEHIPKPLLFLLTPTHLFLSYFYFFCLCIYPLIYCCDYTHLPSFAFLHFCTSFIVG